MGQNVVGLVYMQTAAAHDAILQNSVHCQPPMSGLLVEHLQNDTSCGILKSKLGHNVLYL